MSQQTTSSSQVFDPILLNEVLSERSSKSSKKYEESIERLLALVEAVETNQKAKGSNGEVVANTTSVDVQDVQAQAVEEILNRLGPDLEKALATNPLQAAKMLGDLKVLLLEYVAGKGPNSKEAENVARAIMPALMAHVKEHPENIGSIVTSLEALSGQSGERVRGIMKEAMLQATKIVKDKLGVDVSEHLPTLTGPAEEPDAPTASQIAYTTQLLLAECQGALDESQKKQDEANRKAGQAAVKSAQAQEQKTNDAINKAEQQQVHHFTIVHWIIHVAVICAAVVLGCVAAACGCPMLAVALFGLATYEFVMMCIQFKQDHDGDAKPDLLDKLFHEGGITNPDSGSDNSSPAPTPIY